MLAVAQLGFRTCIGSASSGGFCFAHLSFTQACSCGQGQGAHRTRYQRGGPVREGAATPSAPAAKSPSSEFCWNQSGLSRMRAVCRSLRRSIRLVLTPPPGRDHARSSRAAQAYGTLDASRRCCRKRPAGTALSCRRRGYLTKGCKSTLHAVTSTPCRLVHVWLMCPRTWGCCCLVFLIVLFGGKQATLTLCHLAGLQTTH